MGSTRKIKVLEVIQQGEIGGGESHLLTLISQMDRSRFEPVVVALSDGEMIRRLTDMGITNYVVNTKLPFNMAVWPAIKRILVGNRIDIVHTHGARALSNLYHPASKLSIPIVHTVHGWSFHDHLPAWKRKLRIKGEKFLTGKASMNIVVSDSNRRIGLEQFGRFSCRVINNGVDLSVYAARSGDAIRTEFGIPPSSVVTSFVARFIHDKNPLALVRAFQQVHALYPDSYLVLVGDGPARQSAISLASELGLQKHVILPGFRKDVPEILAASDIFCLPSIKEGLPVSLIEAMAMQNASIATDVQGCVDVITHEKDGLLVSLDKLEEELAAALLTLLSDPAKRRQLAASGRKTVEERFDAVAMARKIEALYLEQVNQKTAVPAV
ncbi:MAG TPA: glycosyltransferase [Flavisolibacter sp.]|nr:glycosyltransferase [Flavisolibacter sp.]